VVVASLSVIKIAISDVSEIQRPESWPFGLMVTVPAENDQDPHRHPSKAGPDRVWNDLHRTGDVSHDRRM